MTLRRRVARVADLAAEGRPNSLLRVLLAVAVAGPAAIRAAAALGAFEAGIAPGAAGGPSATPAAQAAAQEAADRRAPHLAALWHALSGIDWPHGLPVADPAWRLVPLPTVTPDALAEAAAVLDAPAPPDGPAADAHAVAVLRASTAVALDLPWPDLDRHPGVTAGLDALTDGTPWALA